ncbi:hypothetical protein PFLUV_G00260160 [Perca fluviatilis]|uniref:Uncharacterized protein n=1 Tax=Perca fluviatilis TaxID=8168 RepID=A0A6A5DU61_PERFL|nr:hypothetical protein PFLUV_G00260160 [Perca fluviatilis]
MKQPCWFPCFRAQVSERKEGRNYFYKKPLCQNTTPETTFTIKHWTADYSSARGCLTTHGESDQDTGTPGLGNHASSRSPSVP